MNRIRKVDNKYQVLITPEYKVVPDSVVMIGNFTDENLRNYYIVEFDDLEEAQCEALKYNDIDWERFILNHVEIFKRLNMQLKSILDENSFFVECRPKLMNSEELKNTFMDRVINGGERFNLRHKLNDIISFTIINPWVGTLNQIAKILETHREHLHRDDLRLRSKNIIDKKIIILYGYTEFGTMYEIKLIPTLLDQWACWYRRSGNRNEKAALKLYNDLMIQQNNIDSGTNIR
jgi:hypothetical protein